MPCASFADREGLSHFLAVMKCLNVDRSNPGAEYMDLWYVKLSFYEQNMVPPCNVFTSFERSSIGFLWKLCGR